MQTERKRFKKKVKNLFSRDNITKGIIILATLALVASTFSTFLYAILYSL